MFASPQLMNVWRHGTRRFRHLPTTVILGTRRDETRQLGAYLASHPRCFAAPRLETNYFSQHSGRSVGWYRAWFPLSVRVARKQAHVVEASSTYLAMPSALRQMRQVLPKIRVVVLLCDPVSRAFAHFQRSRSLGEEKREFAECVADEIRLEQRPARLGIALEPKAAPMCGYLSQGYYALQLELLHKLYPRNKVLLLDSASLQQDCNATCERVLSFMGLESVEADGQAAASRGQNQASIDPRAIAMLREHYQPYDELLSEISGQQFSWMRPRISVAA